MYCRVGEGNDFVELCLPKLFPRNIWFCFVDKQLKYHHHFKHIDFSGSKGTTSSIPDGLSTPAPLVPTIQSTPLSCIPFRTWPFHNVRHLPFGLISFYSLWYSSLAFSSPPHAFKPRQTVLLDDLLLLENPQYMKITH